MRSYRGEPVVVLLLVIGLWVAVRVMAYDAGIGLAEQQPPTQVPMVAMVPPPDAAPLRLAAPVAGGFGLSGAPSDFASAQRDSGPQSYSPLEPVYYGAAPVQQIYYPRETRVERIYIVQRYLPSPAPGRAAPYYYSGLQLPSPFGDMPGRRPFWTAASAVEALPSAMLAGNPEATPAPFYPAGSESLRRDRRWSADAWLLLRRGGEALSTGISPATYGASQGGAVLRYRLAPSNEHRPAAYLRTTAALNGSEEKEAALGLSARILPQIPVIAAAELRATDQSGRTRLRPAAMLISELPPFALPLGTRGEAYAQAGYVGGRFATPFADGQLRVDRGLAHLGKGELRAGAGAWGGAQKGASRLDVGPTATMGLGLGESAAARVAVDWRFRVTGNAEPSSGPALTLSAGF